MIRKGRYYFFYDFVRNQFWTDFVINYVPLRFIVSAYVFDNLSDIELDKYIQKGTASWLLSNPKVNVSSSSGTTILKSIHP